MGSSHHGHLKVVKYLISKGADMQFGLITSSENGHLKVVKFLVEKGADIDETRLDNSTPLILSSARGHLDVVKFLVSKGADVNAKDDDGSTPLIESSREGHLDIVKYLVRKGADINAKDEIGKTAREWSRENGHLEITNFLLSRGTNEIAPTRSSSVSNTRSRSKPKTQTKIEEDSNDFTSIQSNTESISDKEIKCTNVDLINMENYDTNSENVFTIFYLNNLNKFSSNSCISKNEMKEYLKSEKEDDPSLLTTIWKGGDKSGIGGKPTLKFIIKLPPNNIWITLGSFDRIMNSSIKKWYLLPLYGDKRRRIGYKYGTSANHGQIPGSKIYKAFTKEEIKSGIICKETNSDYPLYLKDFTIQELSDGIKNDVIIKTIKNNFIN
jgi:ankyrin repeat protein